MRLSRIRKLRKSAGLSQEQLAALIGSKRSNISMWESGEREIKAYDLATIASVFNTSVDYVINPDKIYIKPAYAIDLSRLNEKGMTLMRAFYDFLTSHEEYTNKK